jgi:S-layer homology domain
MFGMLGATAAAADEPSSDVPAAASADVAQASPLSDVPLNSWAYDAVNQLAQDGIIKGYPDGTFKGNRPMTRYEAAVLAYRAVDMLEAQITAGKTVEKTDIDAANKLMVAFGNELKAVERHVDVLQQEADSTQKKSDETAALAAATAATVRRAQVHVTAWWRSDAIAENIQANAGPLPERFNGVTYGPGAALPSGIGIAPTGTAVAGSYVSPGGVVSPGLGPTGGLSWGVQPQYAMGQNTNTVGAYNHGLGGELLNLGIGGNPDDHSQYLIRIYQVDKYSSNNYYPAESPAVCTAATIGVAGAACTSSNAQVSNADGYLNNFIRLQQMWYQYTSSGGISVKLGKFPQDEGPRMSQSGSWGLADYVNGIRLGLRDGRFQGQIGYGFEDTAAQNALLYGLPFSAQTAWAQVDYQLGPKRNHDIGAYYSNYSGFHQTLWDQYAVMCTGTGAGAAPIATTTSKVLPLAAGQQYQAGNCGAGYTPIAYGAGGPNAGLPVTGSYLQTMAPHETYVGAFYTGKVGAFTFSADGTVHLGNDPTTGAAWQGRYSGLVEADYGPFIAAPGNKGKWNVEMIGFAAQFNALSPGMEYYESFTPWNYYSTDYSDYYLGTFGVRRWLTDTAALSVFYTHIGLLPNTVIPAGSAACPGCAITGDSRNAVYGMLQLQF